MCRTSFHRCVLGAVCLIVLSGGLSTWADPLPFAFEEPSPDQNATAGHDFFALETIDFKEVQNKRKAPDTSGRKKSMSLAPVWIEPYTRMKKNSLSQEHLRRAERYLDEGRMEDAVREVDIAVLRNPENVLLVGRAALIYATAKEYEQASAHFRIFLQHFPDQVSYLTGWGGVLLRLNDYEQAQIMLKRALELEPEDVPTHFQVQILRLLTGSEDPPWDGWSMIPLVMLESVTQWLIHERNDLVTMLGRERFNELCNTTVGEGSFRNLVDIRLHLQHLSKYQQARENAKLLRACIRLLECDVDNVWIKLTLAQACFDTDRQKKAVEIVTILQDEYPDFYSVWYNGGFIMLQLENYAEAERMYKRALSIREAGDGLFALACAYAGQGKIDDSWTILKELVRADKIALKHWLKGDKPYLRVVKDHPRFYEVGLNID